MFVLVTKSDPGTVTQLVPNPAATESIWTCNRQPKWSAGQESVKALPDRTDVMLIGLKATAGVLAP